MTKTLTNKTSQKIKELGVDVSTEKWWHGNREWVTKESKTVGGMENVIKVPDEKLTWTLGNCKSENPACEKQHPAPNFQELLLALKEIGEKLGWKEWICDFCGEQYDKAQFCKLEICQKIRKELQMIKSCADKKVWKHHVHILTDIFLESGMEGVDRYISEIISNQ